MPVLRSAASGVFAASTIGTTLRWPRPIEMRFGDTEIAVQLVDEA